MTQIEPSHQTQQQTLGFVLLFYLHHINFTVNCIKSKKILVIFEDYPGQMIGKTLFNFVEMLPFIRPSGLAILRNAGGPMRIDWIVL